MFENILPCWFGCGNDCLIFPLTWIQWTDNPFHFCCWKHLFHIFTSFPSHLPFRYFLRSAKLSFCSPIQSLCKIFLQFSLHCPKLETTVHYALRNIMQRPFKAFWFQILIKSKQFWKNFRIVIECVDRDFTWLVLNHEHIYSLPGWLMDWCRK